MATNKPRGKRKLKIGAAAAPKKVAGSEYNISTTYDIHIMARGDGSGGGALQTVLLTETQWATVTHALEYMTALYASAEARRRRESPSQLVRVGDVRAYVMDTPFWKAVRVQKALNAIEAQTKRRRK